MKNLRQVCEEAESQDRADIAEDCAARCPWAVRCRVDYEGGRDDADNGGHYDSENILKGEYYLLWW